MAEVGEFFSTPEMTLHLDLVRHLIENSELVPLVRGPSGIGKSLMAERLQHLAPENWTVCHFSADSMMQPEHLLVNIARCLGLSESPSGMLARLEEHFSSLRKRGTTPVLLVDDAQELPPTSLITLLRLYERQVGGAPLISLVLFADEQIDMLLSTPQLQIMSPQSIQVIDLPPLTRDEAEGFMRHLFRVEGLNDRFVLNSMKLNRIYRDTQGIPGRLTKALLEAVGEEETPQASVWRSERRFVVFGVPLIVVIVLALVFQDRINTLFEPAGVAGPAAAPQASAAGTAPKVTQTGALELSLPRPGERVVAESAGASGPPDESAPPREKPPGTEAPPAGGEVPEIAAEPEAATEPEVATEPEAATTEPKATMEPEQPVKTTDEVAPPGNTVSMEGPMDKGIPSSREPSPRAEALLKGGDWFASQPAGSYTVQLLSGEKLESIQVFMDRYAVGPKAFAVASQRNGKPWYTLLYGVYGDRETALGGLEELPAEVQKSGAWVRSLTSLGP